MHTRLVKRKREPDITDFNHQRHFRLNHLLVGQELVGN